jgi:glucose/arabinose dehydrogenase
VHRSPRSRLAALWALLIPVLWLSGREAVAAPPSGGFVQLVPVVSGLIDPLGVTHAGDGSGRLFIVQQTGQIRIWDGTQLLATPFLDVSAVSSPCGSPPSCGERGLLGLAFHPSYTSNGFFYVDYTRGNGDIVIARYHVSANPNVADPNSGVVLLTIPHSSQPNHNGGQLAFGPDGYLYIGVGDGGGGGDPFESGQSKNTLLGKVLRIDVNSDGFPADPNRNYAIPPSNPFASTPSSSPEIWAYGLRNPWRFSFDRSTHDLYIADVGQGNWEEIDVQPAASSGGQNYGWDCREGAHTFETDSDCSGPSFTDPVLEYDHSAGKCAVIGGYVYRGQPASSVLSGNYLYGDLCTGQIWRAANAGGWTSQQLFDTSLTITTFGESEKGRVYVAGQDGTLEWIAPYTFQDVAPDFWAWQYVEGLAASGITGGCGGNDFCPNTSLNRAEAAVFLVRGVHGSAFVPPPATGTVFTDVPASYWAASYIEQVAADGVAHGCGGGQYCPEALLTRAEAAVLLLRAQHGQSYVPPAGTGTVFHDVPADHWAVSWIEQLAAEGISGGCGGGNYCPNDAITRAEAAVLLTRTFSLTTP